MPRSLFPYGNFIGLDTITAKSNMTDRYLTACVHAYVDFRGQINKQDGFYNIAAPNKNVSAVKHFGLDDIVYFEFDGVNTHARSTVGVSMDVAFSGEPMLDFTQFSNKMIANAKGQQAVVYNGAAFVQNSNIPQGGANATILNRMAVADIPGAETEFRLSRLDNLDDWTITGAPTTADNGAVIDIRNQLSSRDKIKGLGVLEGDKLAIFCQNETLLYSGSTDITKWEIIRDFRVPIGTIGRNTIVPVGVDLFFCSKFGVHSIRRAYSGITLETITLSRVVGNLYEKLVETLPEGKEPHAVWNPNLGQYVTFWPSSDPAIWRRLTFTYEPGTGRGGFQSWAYDPEHESAPEIGELHNLRSASYFSGDFVGGTSSDGLVRQSERDSGDRVDMEVETPILWQGSPAATKQYRRLYVRAAGTARFKVSAYNEHGTLLQETEHVADITDPSFGVVVPDVSPEPVIDIPFRHRARGVRFKFTCDAPGTLKILDFAVRLGG